MTLTPSSSAVCPHHAVVGSLLATVVIPAPHFTCRFAAFAQRLCWLAVHHVSYLYGHTEPRVSTRVRGGRPGNALRKIVHQTYDYRLHVYISFGLEEVEQISDTLQLDVMDNNSQLITFIQQ